MKVMVFVKATPSSEAGVLPTGDALTELLTAMGKYNDELIKAGVLIMADGLQPSSKGVRVRFSGTSRTVTDGPFTETNELVAGFWLWNVRDMAEAVEWVKKCPNPMLEDSDIEIRPLFSAEEFGEMMTPDLRDQEAAQRAQTLGLPRPIFEQGPALNLIGLTQHYTPETRGSIPQQWEKFVGQIRSLTHAAMDYYGVCCNSQPDCSFDYMTAVVAQDCVKYPSTMTALTLAASRYAVFTHTRHVSAIPKVIDTIWTQWVPESGLKVARTPCYERYTPDFNEKTGMGGMEIWIPLES